MPSPVPAPSETLLHSPGIWPVAAAGCVLVGAGIVALLISRRGQMLTAYVILALTPAILGLRAALIGMIHEQMTRPGLPGGALPGRGAALPDDFGARLLHSPAVWVGVAFTVTCWAIAFRWRRLLAARRPTPAEIAAANAPVDRAS
ncbi:hypothetical protein DB346_17585 [Verrucomicrobia bacterium LW23]|nr:hypothetical protein DB346_17585 [Verrucomicrobia bacterium LW23]